MSYDLIIWRGESPESPGVLWKKLYAGESPAGLVPLTFNDVRAAFSAEFGSRVRVRPPLIEGPGFELNVPEVASYLHVCCSYQVDPDVYSKLVHLGETRLGACVYDPQENDGHDLAALSEFEAHDFRALDSIPQTVLVEPGELAVSYGRVQMWTARTEGTENDAVALLHRRFAELLEDCTSVEARYARAVQSVFPFSIIAASGQGISSRGGVSSVSPILGIHQGVAGTLFTPYDQRESSTEDGRRVERWTTLYLIPEADRLVDVTEVIAAVGRSALARAHFGDTRALREFLVHIVGILEGSVVAELAESERPKAAAGFEVFERGAVIPVRSQHGYSSKYLEVQLRIGEERGFRVTTVEHGKAPLACPPEHPLSPETQEWRIVT